MTLTLSRASARRVDALVKLLDRIGRKKETASLGVPQFREHYEKLPRDDRPYFFDAILRQMEVEKPAIEGALAEVLENDAADPIAWSRCLTQLRRRLESPRLRAFRHFLSTSGGLPFLLDVRADILAAHRNSELDLGPLDEEIAHLFTSWFLAGFLFLQELTEESSFRQIRFLKEHDMVHPMASLEEMGSRLGKDRRLFALYHRAMPEDPVVFVEAALTQGLVGSIHEILDAKRPPANSVRDTVIFYSINNTQLGLAGLGLGKALIFQVVDVIRKDHPAVNAFSTLSPIPGFWEHYLECILRGEDATFAMKRARLPEFFPLRQQTEILKAHQECTDLPATDFHSTLIEILSSADWIDERRYTSLLEKPLTGLAYFYLTKEENRRGKPLNPVAGFHLGNGARVSRANVNFAANISARGLRESCGMMVNYVYSDTWLRQLGRTMQSLLT